MNKDIIKRIYSWTDYDNDIKKILKEIEDRKWNIMGIYGVKKGGWPLAVTLANHLNIQLYTTLDDMRYIPDSGKLIVDDISDEGKTLININQICAMKSVTLFIKEDTRFIPNFYCNKAKRNEWIVFPWEPLKKEPKRDNNT